MRYTPEQRKALQRVIGATPAKASAVLGESMERIERFLSNVEDFIRQGHSLIGENRYMFLLDRSSHRGKRVTPSGALKDIRRSTPIFRVDDQLRLGRAVHSPGPLQLGTCQQLTEREGALGILVIGAYKIEILRGKFEDESNVVNPGVSLMSSSKFQRPMSDFTLILGDHKKNQLDREQAVRYWKDRKSRVLLAKPDKTETIFHRSLFAWMKLFVLDKLNMYGEPQGLGQDKNDIVILTIDGSEIIVEIKWLGENEHKTVYGQGRINEGLAQVKIYMDDRDGCTCGHLVVYDARSREIHESQSKYNDSLRHHLCGPPHLLFLESETPTESASRIARASAR